MKKFIKLIHGIDRFGYEVGVNYRGDGNFKTLVGVVATIVNFCVIINFSITKLIDMQTR